MQYHIKIYLTDGDEIHANVEAGGRADAWDQLMNNEQFCNFLNGREIKTSVINESRTPEECNSSYELYTEGDRVMIRRNKPPRFVGVITMDTDSDIQAIEWKDECTALEAAEAMRKAAEFLRKNSRKK